MLFAIITWVRASRWVARAADSSAPWPSSSSHAPARSSRWRWPRARGAAAELRHDLGGQRGWSAMKPWKASTSSTGPAASAAGAGGPVVGQDELLETLDGAERHPPHVLHQPEPEHRRQRPELADGERCHLLERGGEGADVLCIEAPLGVGDELDRQVVDPGIPGERSVREVRQLPVVPARKILADLGDVVLDDVEVVQQPVPGRTDVERRRLGGDPGVRVLEDGESPVEPTQERADASGAPAGPEVLATGDGAGVLGEPPTPSSSPWIGPERRSIGRDGARTRRAVFPEAIRVVRLSSRPSWEPRGRWSVARSSEPTVRGRGSGLKKHRPALETSVCCYSASTLSSPSGAVGTHAGYDRLSQLKRSSAKAWSARLLMSSSSFSSILP